MELLLMVKGFSQEEKQLEAITLRKEGAKGLTTSIKLTTAAANLHGNPL
jgi:hypothetical protein